MLYYLFLIIFFMIDFGLKAQFCNAPTVIGGNDGDACTHLTGCNGNLAAGGIYQQQISLEGQSFQSEGGSDIFINVFDSSNNTIFAKSYGNAVNNELSSICSDSLGNLYISGTFSGTITIEGQQLFSNTISNFILKLSPTGQFLWIKLLKGNGVNHVNDMQVSPDGQFLWLTGNFNDSLFYDGTDIYSNALNNLFILKVDASNGNLQWLNKLPGAKWIKGNSIAVLANQTAWVACEFKDSLSIMGESYYFSSIYVDILLLQISEDGVWLNHKRWGGVYDDIPVKLRFYDDNLWLGGHFVGVLDVDTTRLMTAFRYYDLFWVKMDTAANVLNVGQTNTNANTYLMDMSLHRGMLQLGGYFQDSLNATQTHYSNGGFDIFHLEIDSNVQYLNGSSTYGSFTNDLLNGLATFSAGLAAAGTFSNSMIIDNQNIIANGFSDAWIACLGKMPILSELTRMTAPQLNFKVKPNPSEHSFKIIFENDSFTNFNWELYSMNAQMLMNGKSDIIDARDLPPGIYSLKIYTENRYGFTKLIKK